MPLLSRLAVLAVLASAACIDFVEPDVSSRGGPAVLDASIVLRGDTVIVSGALAPGLDREGFRREPRRASVIVNGTEFRPSAVLNDGRRIYDDELRLQMSPTAILVEAPELEEIDAPAPVLSWPIASRVGSERISLPRGADLELHTMVTGVTPQPPPETRQWTLQLTGDPDDVFTIGARGEPPDTIVVPARWLPQAPNLLAVLTYQQSTVIQPAPGDYIAVVRLDTRVGWLVHRQQ
jgi:hypothetical protein